jgi:hypothetical protein
LLKAEGRLYASDTVETVRPEPPCRHKRDGDKLTADS